MAHSAHRGLSMAVFAGVLNDDDARRATEVVEAVHTHGIRCALTGGLAIDAQLRKHGRPDSRCSYRVKPQRLITSWKRRSLR
jgi:hypothetical protein